MSAAAQSTENPQPGWTWYLPILAIYAWWIYDLQFQWRVLPEYNFGFIVVALVAYLVWDRWEARPRDDVPAPLWQSVVLIVFGAPMVLIVELYKSGIANTPSTSFGLSLGCVCFISAMLLYGWGWKTLKHFMFPLLFLFVAVPLPSIIYQQIVLGLKAFVTSINVEALNTIGIPAKQTGSVIQLPQCVVGIDEACSGVRSLQSSIMAALFFGYTMVKRNSLRAFLVVAGILLAVVGNFIRSFFLSYTAHHQGIESINKYHDTAGWSVLAMTAVGLVMLSFFLAKLESLAQARADKRAAAEAATSAPGLKESGAPIS